MKKTKKLSSKKAKSVKGGNGRDYSSNGETSWLHGKSSMAVKNPQVNASVKKVILKK